MNIQKIRVLVACFLIVGNLMVSAFATNTIQFPQEEPQKQETIARAEQFMTYYRISNGVKQYRIWNMTKGIWVTPWTDC